MDRQGLCYRIEVSELWWTNVDAVKERSLLEEINGKEGIFIGVRVGTITRHVVIVGIEGKQVWDEVCLGGHGSGSSNSVHSSSNSSRRRNMDGVNSWMDKDKMDKEVEISVWNVFVNGLRDRFCRQLGLVRMANGYFVQLRAPELGHLLFHSSFDGTCVFVGVSFCARAKWRHVTLADSVDCEVSNIPKMVCVAGLASVGRLLGMAECSEMAAIKVSEQWGKEHGLVAVNPLSVAKILLPEQKVILAPLEFVLCEVSSTTTAAPDLLLLEGTPLQLAKRRRGMEMTTTAEDVEGAVDASAGPHQGNGDGARMQIEEVRSTWCWPDDSDDVWGQINDPVPPKSFLVDWSPAAGVLHNEGPVPLYIPPPESVRIKDMAAVDLAPPLSTTVTPAPTPEVVLAHFTPNTPITPGTPSLAESHEDPSVADVGGAGDVGGAAAAVGGRRDFAAVDLRWHRWLHAQWHWCRSRTVCFGPSSVAAGSWCHHDQLPWEVDLLPSRLRMRTDTPPALIDVGFPKARVKFFGESGEADGKNTERVADVDMAVLQLWDKCRLQPIREGKNVAFVALCHGSQGVLSATRNAMVSISSVWASHYLGTHVPVAECGEAGVNEGGVLEVRELSLVAFVEAWKAFESVYRGHITESNRRDLVVYIVWPLQRPRERLWQLLQQLHATVGSHCVVQVIPEAFVTAPLEFGLSPLRELCFAVFFLVRRFAVASRPGHYLHEPLFLRSHKLLQPDRVSLHVAFCCHPDQRGVSIVATDPTGELWHSEDARLADQIEVSLANALWRVVGLCLPRVQQSRPQLSWNVVFMDCEDMWGRERGTRFRTPSIWLHHARKEQLPPLHIMCAHVMPNRLFFPLAGARGVHHIHGQPVRITGWSDDKSDDKRPLALFRVCSQKVSLLVAPMMESVASEMAVLHCQELALMMKNDELPIHVAAVVDFASL